MCPCLYACAGPLAGKVTIAVREDAAGDDAKNVNGDYLHIAPAGRYTIDLSYKAVAVNGHTFEFPKGSCVRYGESWYCNGQGARTRLNRFWGDAHPSLADAGGKVEVRRHESIRLGCRAWAPAAADPPPQGPARATATIPDRAELDVRRRQRGRPTWRSCRMRSSPLTRRWA